MLELLLTLTANAGGCMIGNNILKQFSTGIAKNKVTKAVVFVGSICLAEAVGEIAGKQMEKFINDFKEVKNVVKETKKLLKKIKEDRK